MNNRLLELEIKKILQEYKLLLLDEEYKNEMIDINKAEFINEINKKGGFPPETEVPKVEEEAPHIEEEEVEEEEEEDEKTSALKESVKKLYRQIVKMTHPDKTMHKNNKKELGELYIRAKKAMATMDVYELLTICDKLDIEYKIDINQKVMLQENLEKKKIHIKSLEESFIWLWINAKDAGEKEYIVDLFVQKHKKNI
jgi:hypothetical protein